MGWLGTLFLLGAIYNLFVGDFLNATAEISIAIAIFIVAFLWPYTEEKITDRVRIVVLAIVPSLALFYVVSALLEEAEVGPDKYDQILKIKNSSSELNTSIMAAIKDGKISVVEYYQIKKKYNQLRLEAAKNALSSK